MSNVIKFSGKYEESPDDTPTNDMSNVVEHPNRAAMLAQELKDEFTVAANRNFEAKQAIINPEADAIAKEAHDYIDGAINKGSITLRAEEMKSAHIRVRALSFEEVIDAILHATPRDWDADPYYWISVANRVIGRR